MTAPERYISDWNEFFDGSSLEPWELTSSLQQLITGKFQALDRAFRVKDQIAIHKDARIDEHVILKGPIIISSGCFIGAHAYLRGGVMLGPGVSIGPGCEVKSSALFRNSVLAHFNFVGDSILGSHVNLEAGAVIANHFNERTDKTIHVMLDGARVRIGCTKFGGLVGDHTKIGANAVLSPGTVLPPHSIIGRLSLVNQDVGQ